MKFYPILLRVGARRCLVVGGGDVAEQKISSLLAAAANVIVVAPTVTANVDSWASNGNLTLHRRPYESSDLDGVLLAIAATDDHTVHEIIARDAAERGVLLNVVDCPSLCTFIVPAVHQRGDLVIAVSTSGTSPALAKRVRTDLADLFGSEYETALVILGQLRRRLATPDWSSGERRRIFAALVDSPLIDHLRDGDLAGVDRILAATIGPDISLANLGVAT